MARYNSFFRVGDQVLRWLACGLVLALFTWSIAQLYIPGKGFTYLIEFGGIHHARFLPELKAANHYELPGSPGYDAQWYVQIAMHPRLSDPVLNQAVDTLPYRARRILFEWTAWVMGGGDPRRVMMIYSLQNVGCWFLLSALLLRWFPPVSWGNVFRWAAMLYSFGLIFSVKAALLDGPGLLLIGIAVALVESKRPWLGALVIGISGLGKDTSVLCGSALGPPDPRNPRTWAPWLARVTLIILPLCLWMLCLRLWLGPGDNLGLDNFAGPFVGMRDKYVDTFSSLVAEGFPYASAVKFDALVLVGLLAQFLFFALRMRWGEAWWRVGASYAVLSLFLGHAVWGNYPCAAARVVLPMTLAFNILVPRGGWWPMLLVVGNLGVFGSADLLSLRPPDRVAECFVVEGPGDLRFNPADGFSVAAVYGGDNWWFPEKKDRGGKRGFDTWRWSKGDSTIAIHNPHPFPLTADVRFGMATANVRGMRVSIKGKVAWSGTLERGQDNHASIEGIELLPGDTELLFQSDRPAVYYEPKDPRTFAFSVRNLEIILKGKAPAPP